MTFTKIQETKKGRFALFLDGEFRFSVHKDIFLLHHEIALGKTLSVEGLEELRLADDAYSCREKALSILDYSPQSAGRLAEKLERFYEKETVAGVVERLARVGLLDDLDYGRRLAADLLNLRGASLRRVRQELQKRKLDRQTIDQVLGELEDTDQVPVVVALILKKYKTQILDEKGLAKTKAALLRRGFSYGEVREALTLIEEEQLYEQ